MHFNILHLSGNTVIRQSFCQDSAYIFRQQTLQKLYSIYTSRNLILSFLCFTAPLLTGNGVMDYIVVMSGLPVSVYAFLLWLVDGVTMSVYYQRVQDGRTGNWIGRKQVVSILI